MHYTRTVFIFIFFSLFRFNCATPRLPQGGAKDTIAPEIIDTYPAKRSLFFKDKKIILIFDKKINVHDLYNQLLITPCLKNLKGAPNYTYKNKKYSVRLDLHSPLEERTTYTFNFREAIKDITEGNIAKNPVIVFSTGAYIDTMHIQGKVKYLMTDKPGENCLVSLYKANNDTLDIFNSVPEN